MMCSTAAVTYMTIVCEGQTFPYMSRNSLVWYDGSVCIHNSFALFVLAPLFLFPRMCGPYCSRLALYRGHYYQHVLNRAGSESKAIPHYICIALLHIDTLLHLHTPPWVPWVYSIVCIRHTLTQGVLPQHITTPPWVYNIVCIRHSQAPHENQHDTKDDAKRRRQQ